MCLLILDRESDNWKLFTYNNTAINPWLGNLETKCTPPAVPEAGEAEEEAGPKEI